MIQAKYYARVANLPPMSAPKLDTDLLYAKIIMFKNDYHVEKISTYSFSEPMRLVSIFSYICFSNITIMLCGLYVIKLRRYDEFNRFLKLLFNINEDIQNTVFWSVCSVIMVVNCVLLLSDTILIFISKRYSIYFMLNVIIIFLFVPAQFCVVSCCLNNEKNCNISNECFVRVPHSFALCNMIWFAHRVTNCFFVSIYFVAIAPSQTFAVISLLIFIITIAIIGITSVVYLCSKDNTKMCPKICNSITIVLLVISVITTWVFFTIICVDLTQHGLSVSHVGSIFISMLIPTLILGLSIAIKRHFKGKKKSDEEGQMLTTTF